MMCDKQVVGVPTTLHTHATRVPKVTLQRPEEMCPAVMECLQNVDRIKVENDMDVVTEEDPIDIKSDEKCTQSALAVEKTELEQSIDRMKVENDMDVVTEEDSVDMKSDEVYTSSAFCVEKSETEMAADGFILTASFLPSSPSVVFHTTVRQECESASPYTTKVKNRRKAISIEQKLNVISQLEKGERIVDICRNVRLAHSTVRTIRDNADRIKESAKSGAKLSAERTSYSRSLIMVRMEKMLSTWIEDQNQRHMPVSMRLVQAKALSIYEDLSKGVDNVKPFIASTGWFSKFRKRYNFHDIKMTGEVASADTMAAEKFVQELQHTIEEGGYSPKQIFNIDETALFWKKMPSKTFISREEKSVPRFKASKDRCMLLLGGNAEGDYKLKPVMVYHSANHYALKDCVKHLLPVHFYSNTKAWVTGPLFSDYLTSKLEGELREYCAKENLAFKILLIVDSAPGHPRTVQDLCEHIKVVFIPPNTTSVIQPMDQGVIATFKAYYLKKTFDTMVKAMDNKNMSVKEFWKKFSIRDAVMLVGEAWAAVTHLCMNIVWRSVCPEVVYDFEGFSVDEDVNKTKEEIVQLAYKVGFNEVDLTDVEDLLSHNGELSNEDLIGLEKESREEVGVEGMAEVEVVHALTSKRLSEALRLFDEGLSILEEDDPNTERSSKVKRDILASLTCYSEMLKERNMKASQTLNSLSYMESVGPEPQPSTSSSQSAEQVFCDNEDLVHLPCITSSYPTFLSSDPDDPLS